MVGSAAGIATASLTGPGGAVAGDLVGTAAGQTFDGILNGFGDAEDKRIKQVYKNILKQGDAESSAVLTVQESVKAATQDNAVATAVGSDVSQGLDDAQGVIDKIKARGDE
ncbi:hypothetical protein [Streptomyces sp. SPB074]|uniref:hypothetical protein n=1 Tax=Streptomyces sp. (strain SPB074) TaxID=465543 RepID=UPI00017FEBCB|nr:hypothetical protein [Streptomyces sp. SPB074]